MAGVSRQAIARSVPRASVSPAMLRRSSAPKADPPTDADVARVASFLRGERGTLLLAGAGMSTESGVPDYRSPSGAYSKGHRPMRDQEFRAKEFNRRRYWTRSFQGWRDITENAGPNMAHRAVASLLKNGAVSGLVTQNVDRLDIRAGTPPSRILELHGTTHEVVCLDCGTITCRHKVQRRLATLNDGVFRQSPDPNGVQRPDGDADVHDVDLSQVRVPGCEECGGVLMPNVVFFGGNVRREVASASREMVADSDSVLVLGTSLSTWSSYRLAKQAHEEGKPIGIVNLGETRADPLASFKVEARVGELLGRLLPSFALPAGLAE